MIKKIICCSTMKAEIETINKKIKLPAEFLDYGLHRCPDKLNKSLQEIIASTPAIYTHLLFCYGLCSHGVTGLNSRKHTLVVPRVHDCISLLLGSRKKYQEEFRKEPGTIYLSKGWIDFGGDPLFSLKRYSERVGEENARWVIGEEYKNYKRLVFINTPVKEDLAPYRFYARKTANFLQLNYEEVEGSLTLMKNLVEGRWDDDFAVIEPGQMIIRNLFV